MKSFNKKNMIWSTLALLGLIGIFTVYQVVQDARAQTASINTLLNSFLQTGCQVQVERCNHPLEVMPPPATIDVNQDLHALVTQLKQLKYQARSEPGVPACGDMVVLTSLCNPEYDVWISSFGVFLIPQRSTARYAYDSRSSRSLDQKVFKQATRFFQSLK